MEFSLSVVDLVGKQFGNYKLLRLLGRGGFADVYLGKHLYLDSEAADAAIKVLQERLLDEGYRDFVHEASILVELSHPSIIGLRDFGVEQGQPFLVMDYASHGTLRELHSRGEQIDLLATIAYIKQIAGALQYAHNRKVIHCDLKPNNILLGRQYELLVSDFGIARIVSTTRPTAVQVEKHVSGTSLYMAPEQFQGEGDFASDQYSLAVMAYEWLCGRPPFKGSFVELFSQHQLIPPASPRAYNPSIPHEVEQVLLRALSKDPTQRYPNIETFASAFEEAARPSLLDQTAPSLLSPEVVAPSSTQPAAFVTAEDMSEPFTPPSAPAVARVSDAGVVPDGIIPPPGEDFATLPAAEQSAASDSAGQDDPSAGNYRISSIAPAQPEPEKSPSDKMTPSDKKPQSVSLLDVPDPRRTIYRKLQSRILLALLAVLLLSSVLATVFVSINGAQTSSRASGGSSRGGEETVTVSETNGTRTASVHPTATAGAKTSQSPTPTLTPTVGVTPVSTSAASGSTGTIPTATQQSAPAPTPTPTPHPCQEGHVTSNPIYQGNGYAYSNGGTYRTASAYCNGRAYFVFTETPPVADTEVRLCEVGKSTCGGWVEFTSVGSKLLIARGMVANTTSFHLQFQGYGATASYTVYGVLYF